MGHSVWGAALCVALKTQSLGADRWRGMQSNCSAFVIGQRWKFCQKVQNISLSSVSADTASQYLLAQRNRTVSLALVLCMQMLRESDWTGEWRYTVTSIEIKPLTSFGGVL